MSLRGRGCGGKQFGHYACGFVPAFGRAEPTRDAKGRVMHGAPGGMGGSLVRGSLGSGLGGFVRGLVRLGGVLVCLLGVVVRLDGVLVSDFVVAGFVVLGCGVVGFGGFFVVGGCGLVCFVGHGRSPVTGLSGGGDGRGGRVSLA